MSPLAKLREGSLRSPVEFSREPVAPNAAAKQCPKKLAAVPRNGAEMTFSLSRVFAQSRSLFSTLFGVTIDGGFLPTRCRFLRTSAVRRMLSRTEPGVTPGPQASAEENWPLSLPSARRTRRPTLRTADRTRTRRPPPIAVPHNWPARSRNIAAVGMTNRRWSHDARWFNYSKRRTARNRGKRVARKLALRREESLPAVLARKEGRQRGRGRRTRAANDLWAEGKRDEAVATLVQARGMASKIWGEQTYGVANLLDQEAHWRKAGGDTAQAEKLFRQALADSRTSIHAGSSRVDRHGQRLGACCWPPGAPMKRRRCCDVLSPPRQKYGANRTPNTLAN